MEQSKTRMLAEAGVAIAIAQAVSYTHLDVYKSQAAGCVCSSVDAHGVFFANRLDEQALVLGEGPVDDAYSPEMVKSIIG